MWFIISILILLWLIGYITYGAAAYWVHTLLVAALVLIVITFRRGRRATSD